MKRITASEGKAAYVIVLILISAFGGIALYNFWKFRTQINKEASKFTAIPVETSSVKTRRLEWVLEQTGDIYPILKVNVYSKISGKIIQKIDVEKGDFVKKGDLIATLEDQTIKTQIREGEAALRSAKAKLAQIEAQPTWSNAKCNTKTIRITPD
jgi:HlyD family secretion protein